MTRTKQAPPQEPLKVLSVKITPAAERTLQRLSQNASDRLGWTVSSSAVMRALLLYVEQQTPAWREGLLPIIEEEIAQGRVWGKKSGQPSAAH